MKPGRIIHLPAERTCDTCADADQDSFDAEGATVYCTKCYEWQTRASIRQCWRRKKESEPWSI